MRIVLVCNPENRRVQAFSNAAMNLSLPRPQVISYNDILDGNVAISDYLGPETILRIESPGENFDTEKKIIARGANIPCNGAGERISFNEALKLSLEYGRIRFLRQWYLGFRDLLSVIELEITATGCRVFNSPASISLMFDKVKCHQRLKEHGTPVPDEIRLPKNYDELKHFLERQRYKRVFLKPAHASSASGVIGYRIQGEKEEIITSVELVHEANDVRFYNSLKLKRYNDKNDIRLLIDFILSEGALIQHWIPKASLDGKFFDARVVVINGKARAVLPRLSSGPITNLHLGNQRGNVRQIKTLLGCESYHRMIACAEEAVSVINGAFYAGVDLLITAGSNNPRVLELNAFGDLLPGVIMDNGDDIYTCALKEVLHAA